MTNEIIRLLRKFIKQSRETNDLKYGDYTKEFNFLNNKITTSASFGIGVKAFITVFAILKHGQKVTNGYYPVYLYDHKNNILILAYGVSVDNEPKITWIFNENEEPKKLENINTIGDRFRKYEKSYFFKKYEINDKNEIVKDNSLLVEDINEILSNYLSIGYKMKSNVLENIFKNTIKLLTDKKQIILYGPAGTGKTYNTKNIIVTHETNSFNLSSDEINKKYDELKKFDRVKFVTFHQSFAYEDFIEGIKPNLNNKEISYSVEYGIFKKIAITAKENYQNSLKDEAQFKQDELLKTKFELFIHESLENKTEFTKSQGGIFYIDDINDDNIVVLSADSKHSEGKLLIPIRDINIALEFNGRGQIKTSKNYALEIFKRKTPYQIDSYIFTILKEFDRQLENIKIEKIEDKNELQNYYLIIDEINRGNISKIFGELITLLEASKRLGEDDELTTALPYSKQEFGIPPNIYIIGTMNTSDKSIAHLDIALRRRFGFIEMLPYYDVIDDEMCRKLLKELNNRIEILLDKDHLIGHSFFINKTKSDIDHIMQYEIVPLLEEYFYGDYEKIQLVLKNTDYELFASDKKIPEDLKQYTSKDKLYYYWFEKDNDSSN